VMLARFLIVLLLLPVLGACSLTPEQSAAEALSALCRGDADLFASHLTSESRRLFKGLKTESPDRFTCTKECSPTAGVDRRAGPIALVSVDGCGDMPQLVMIHENGAWKLDLFSTESGLPQDLGQEDGP